MNQVFTSPALITAIARESALRSLNKAYHNGSPLVPDSEYDTMWRQHEADRKALADWWDWPTILDQVGAAPKPTSGFARVQHSTPMLSINDVFEGERDEQYAELRAFVDKMEAALGNDAWPMLVEPKVDGVAAKVIYADGLLKIGMTRGDGQVGDDITENLCISGIVPQAIESGNKAPLQTHDAWRSLHRHVEIVGEIYMPIEGFNKANAEREEQGLVTWANPRNAAAGSIKILNNADELRKRPLAFIRHGGWSPCIDGIDHVACWTAYNWDHLVSGVESVRTAEHDFAIDGAVIKIPEGRGREILGMGTRAPNWACAFKFKPVQVTTTLEGITFQVGRTGALTPVAQLKPVLVDGTTVSRATLHNEEFINTLGLQIGDEVVLQKAGAIIPEIVESVTFKGKYERYLAHYRPECPDEASAVAATEFTLDQERPPFSLVAHLGGKCPACGSTALRKQEVQKGEGARWMCGNDACTPRLAARIKHMCSRQCLDIEGIGEEMAGAIAEAMTVMNEDDPFDLFEWTASDLMVMTWTTESGGTMTFGKSRAEKAVKAMERAKSLPLNRWLCAIGIHTIGENTSKEISRLCKNPEDLEYQCGRGGLFDILGTPHKRAENAELITRHNVSSHLGPVSSDQLLEFVLSEEGHSLLHRLYGWGVKSSNYDPIPQASDAKPLFGKSFAITGTLSVGRDEMKALIESKGGKVSGSVSKNTYFLVAGEGGGQKADKARAAGVTILDEAQLRAML